MSDDPVLTVDEFEAIVQTGLDASIIQDAIDRAVADLEHELHGPLTGERVQALLPGGGHDGPLYLARYTDAVVVTDATADVDADSIRLYIRDGAIERADGAWRGAVAVTYTPNDKLRVRAGLIDLVRDQLVPDRNREAGGARDTDTTNAIARRQRLIRSLRPRPRIGTLSIRTVDRLTPVLGG